MKYTEICPKPLTFIALCGMKLEVFNALFLKFKVVASDYFTNYSFNGKKRKRGMTFHKNSVFKSYEDMLIFILIYLKNYPLQEFHAAYFGMSQPQANLWIQKLKKLLRETLRKDKKLPKRSDTEMDAVLRYANELYIDGVERPIQRPYDYEVQHENFSGKKNDIQ